MTRSASIALVGSTGSIGQSTLKVVDRYPDRLRVVALAGGSNVDELISQCRRYHPEIVAIADDKRRATLIEAMRGTQVTIASGAEGVQAVAAWPSATTTVIASVGFTGVRPTLAAIAAGKQVALANKETLVAAGSVVVSAARRAGITISPIDSEHSAIWQCLRAGNKGEVRRLILTASGGPFRTRPLATFDRITPEEALAHPTWNMGPRITVDSATMMNKGFEIMEAAWLFDVPPDRVDVVIHPQSIVHSMVEFQDNSVVAQLGVPDMTLPITYALFATERPPAASEAPVYDPVEHGQLQFFAPEAERYPALRLARDASLLGATGGCVLNAADEVAVAAFLKGELPFTGIPAVVKEVLAQHHVVSDPSIDDIEAADRWARECAQAIVTGRK
jgi:1-deoxy-D-xylulose-5-phosphate reductoisomerase